MVNTVFFKKVKSLCTLPHCAIALIVVVATLLRIWDLDRLGIFFSDAAHDVTVAADALQTRTIPLLGIASSVPRFHQGPLAIWFEMLFLLISGNSLYIVSIGFALLSVLAVIGIYEITTLSLGNRAGVWAAGLLAFSPLAIAHARVPYHITPIPVFLTLYLYALLKLWHKAPRSWFWATLSFCALFQFELALIPLALLIPFVWWQTGGKKRKILVKEIAIGAVVGLLPQLIFDFSHRFAQLGGFAVWMVYRVVAFFGYRHDHTFSLGQLAGTARLTWTYFFRIWSVDQLWLALLCLLLLISSVILLAWRIQHHQKIPPLMQCTALATILLLLGDIVHSAPSEAYFPPFLVLTAIMISYALEAVWTRVKILPIIFVLVFAVVNTTAIIRTGFFIGDGTNFSYGSSIGEQREMMSLIERRTKNHFHLLTTSEAGKFPNYFDNLRWIAREKGIQEDAHGIPIYVEGKDSPLLTYPSITRYVFAHQDVYAK